VDGIPSVRAVVGDSLSKPRAELRLEVLMSLMKVILGSVSSSVTHGAARSEIEKRDALQRWAGAPPPQCYGASWRRRH
jgi:hypothetical protein